MNVAESLELEYEEILDEREQAFLIKFSSAEITWIPKSQARILGNRLYIPKWLVKAKGLEEFIIKD